MLRPTTCYGVGSAFAEALVRRALTDPRAGQSLGAGLTMQLVHVRDLAEVIVQAGTGWAGPVVGKEDDDESEEAIAESDGGMEA